MVTVEDTDSFSLTVAKTLSMPIKMLIIAKLMGKRLLLILKKVIFCVN